MYKRGKLLRKITKASFPLGLALCVHAPSFASFLDNDFYCRTYGCAVVHDGQNYDIYDNYVFTTSSCCVPVGAKMRPRSQNFGKFNLTGTRTKHVGPNTKQGMMLGVAQDGNVVSRSVNDDGDGYLDANDSFGGVFQMGALTDIALDGHGKAYSHSFYITSRNTRLSVRALASIANSTHDFASTVLLSDIKIDAEFTRSGNDAGFRFGGRASSSGVQTLTSINDLGDLQTTPTKMFNFSRFNGVRRRGGRFRAQTIRLDFLYTMPNYDMSMGVGSLNIDMVFDLYRE